MDLGQKILDKILIGKNRSFADIPKENIDNTLKALQLESIDDLFTSIANGSQSPKLVAKRLFKQ